MGRFGRAAADRRLPFSLKRLDHLTRHLEQSSTQAARSTLFCRPASLSDQHWRLFPDFRQRLVYLDIETTGMGSPADTITTIALYDGRTVRWYVQALTWRVSGKRSWITTWSSPITASVLIFLFLRARLGTAWIRCISTCATFSQAWDIVAVSRGVNANSESTGKNWMASTLFCSPALG